MNDKSNKYYDAGTRLYCEDNGREYICMLEAADDLKIGYTTLARKLAHADEAVVGGYRLIIVKRRPRRTVSEGISKPVDHIAEQKFNCFKQEQEKEKMRTFKGLKIPADVDQSYEPRPPDNLLKYHVVCRQSGTARIDCTRISCNECILSTDHAETADEYFKINHQDKRQMPIDTSKIDLDHTIYEFASFVFSPSTARYYVLIRFHIDRAAAESMLNYLPIPSNIFWVQGSAYPTKCALMIPYTLKSEAEACRDDISQALHRLKPKSEVDEFLDASRACSEGVAFTKDCKSMAEVWDKAVSTGRKDYLRFMLSALRGGECARFNKSGQTDAELDWFSTNVSTMPDLIFQQSFRSINPFKEKEN